MSTPTGGLAAATGSAAPVADLVHAAFEFPPDAGQDQDGEPDDIGVVARDISKYAIGLGAKRL